MAHDHGLYLIAKLAQGVTEEQVLEALNPIIGMVSDYEYAISDGNFMFESSGDVSDSIHNAINAASEKLGPLTSLAGEIVFCDHDTPDLENAIRRVIFGPSKEAIDAFTARRDVLAALALMAPHLPEEDLDKIRDIIVQGVPGLKSP